MSLRFDARQAEIALLLVSDAHPNVLKYYGTLQTLNPKPRNPKPHTPNPKSHTPNPKPHTPNPEPQTPNPKSKTPNPKPKSKIKIQNQKPRTQTLY